MCYIMNCESLKNKSNYFLTCKYFQLILQPLQTFRLLVLLVLLLLFHSIRQFVQCNSCHSWILYGKLYTLKTKMISGLIKLWLSAFSLIFIIILCKKTIQVEQEGRCLQQKYVNGKRYLWHIRERERETAESGEWRGLE